MTDVHTFGELLGQMRRSARLKQSEAAERAGISENYWGKLERGDAPASALPLRTFRSVARALEASDVQTYQLARLAGGELEEDFMWAGDVTKTVGGTLPRLGAIIEMHPELRSAQDRVTLLSMLRVILERERLLQEHGEASDARLLRNEEPEVEAGS